MTPPHQRTPPTPRRTDAGRITVRTLGAGLLLVVLAACGSSSGGSGTASNADRPRTPATLEILEPAPNATTGPDASVRLQLTDAKLVPGTQITGGLQPRRGHVHLSVDGELYSMTDSLTQEIRALAPGVHTVQAEFVASDHLPFRNRVVAAVSFEVAP